jgi:hypothetical protein
MKRIDRRRFLALAGAGSVAAVSGIGSSAAGALAAPQRKGLVTFRGMAALPAKPLPSYATYLVEGHVDLAQKSGVITTTLFAGSPESLSSIAFPGLSRVMRVVDVVVSGSRLKITAVVDDRSQLRPGENAVNHITLNLRRGTGTATFIGSRVQLQIET